MFDAMTLNMFHVTFTNLNLANEFVKCNIFAGDTLCHAMTLTFDA